MVVFSSVGTKLNKNPTLMKKISLLSVQTQGEYHPIAVS